MNGNHDASSPLTATELGSIPGLFRSNLEALYLHFGRLTPKSQLLKPTSNKCIATKCHASSNKCLTSSNKKLHFLRLVSKPEKGGYESQCLQFWLLRNLSHTLYPSIHPLTHLASHLPLSCNLSISPSISQFHPGSNGLQPTSDGFQPTSDGLHPSSNGLQLCVGCET